MKRPASRLPHTPSTAPRPTFKAQQRPSINTPKQQRRYRDIPETLSRQRHGPPLPFIGKTGRPRPQSRNRKRSRRRLYRYRPRIPVRYRRDAYQPPSSHTFKLRRSRVVLSPADPRDTNRRGVSHTCILKLSAPSALFVTPPNKRLPCKRQFCRRRRYAPLCLPRSKTVGELRWRQNPAVRESDRTRRSAVVVILPQPVAPKIVDRSRRSFSMIRAKTHVTGFEITSPADQRYDKSGNRTARPAKSVGGNRNRQFGRIPSRRRVGDIPPPGFRQRRRYSQLE